ncbi:hypothetical protein [Sulfuracidifex metallicus]|nr:hypothetical protein [Sulfuracidifex metallicus]WOE51889.1 hypothetical protein RQ359_001232 [Sulfuracidifex metallicus DSM 6482 = JCM 9184]
MNLQIVSSVIAPLLILQPYTLESSAAYNPIPYPGSGGVLTAKMYTS